jgi:hypothetical protein
MIIMRPDSHKLPGHDGADVLELISPLHLRTAWALLDLEELEIEVEGDQSWWEHPDAADLSDWKKSYLWTTSGNLVTGLTLSR